MRQSRPFFALLSLILACGPDNSGGSDTEPLPETGDDATGTAPAECPADLEPFANPDAYAEALAQATCAKLAACDCTEVPDTCVADHTEVNLGRNAVYLAAGSVFDPLCARKLVLRHEWTACGLDSTDPCGFCEDFVGTRAEGDACQLIAGTVDPCGPRLFCNGGTCTGPVPWLGEDAPCRDGDVVLGACEAGLLCDFDQDICVPVPKLGEPCRDLVCGPGAWCSTSDSPTGVCLATRPGGGPCSHPIQCESRVCEQSVCSDEPLYCLYR